MNLYASFLAPLSPILAMVGASVGLTVLEFFPKYPMLRLKLLVAAAGSIASIAFAVGLYLNAIPTLPLPLEDASWLVAFQKAYTLDTLSLTFFIGIALFTLFTHIFMSAHYGESTIRGDLLLLTIFVATGMMLLVSTTNLLIIFLALELLSLPTYVMVGVQQRDRRSCEAALKYFLFGAFASVLFVLGITLLYMQFKSLSLPEIAEFVKGYSVQPPLKNVYTYAGLALLLIAAGFKVGLVPFHMWVPDVYQGAPSPVTGFMGSAIKLAGFGLLARVLWGAFLPMSSHWQGTLEFLAILSMFIGNIAALAQDNLKRMFAYSSIAHAGYLALGVAAVSTTDTSASLSALYYYLIVYGLMFLGFFATLTLIERKTGSCNIYQLSGLGFTRPLLAFCLALFVLSGAGIPPTAGFFAKYFIFLQAVQVGKTPQVVLAVISSLIGVYYYLRVMVYLYMKESKEQINIPPSHRLSFASIMVCALSMLFLALFPFP